MKVVCKVSDISTLTYLKVYEVVYDNVDGGGYIIITERDENIENLLQ